MTDGHADDTARSSVGDARGAASADVAARREAEAALRLSEERARLALDAANLGSFLWHPDEDHAESDARMLALFGLPSDGDLGLSLALSALIHPDDRARYADAVARAVDPAGDGTLHEEIRVVRPDGGERWVVVTARTAFSNDGSQRRAVRMSGVASDVTERRRVNEALRASEARYRALATASADVIYRMSPDWREMRQLDGRGFLSDTVEPSDAWLSRYIHPDDQPAVTAAIEAAVQYKHTFEMEHRVIRADGTLGWTASRAVPVRDATGAIVEWIGAASDVTARKEAELALRASEARYRKLFDSIDEGFCVVEVLFDEDGRAADYRFLEANRAFLKQTGLTDAIGRRMRELAPAHEAHWFEIYGRVALTGEPTRFEAPAAALGHWYDVYAFRMGDPAEHRVAILFNDIAPRKDAEAALRASELRYRTLLDNVLDYAIFLLDAEGTITEWTPGAARVKGYAAEEVVGRHVSVFFTPEAMAAGEVEREMAEAAERGRAEREQWRVRKGGTRFWADEVMTAVRNTEGRLLGFTTISRDLTERRAADEASTRARTEADRDDLRRQLAAAEEGERRRLARELHDQLGQHLTALSLSLAETRRLLRESHQAEARLEKLEELVRIMTRDARYLAIELRPPELDDVGFESALETYVTQWRDRYGVPAEVVVTGLAADRALPDDVGTALYRIVQEALTNVAKHAAATQVSVVVDKPNGEVRLAIEDDGRGFDPEEVASRTRREGRLGLAGMRERAALVGGAIELESAPGSGTTVYARVPLTGDRDAAPGP